MPAPVIASAACTVAPPREHRQAREAVPFVRAQQLVAPVDGRAQRVLARRRVARRGARRADRGVEALGDLRG